MERTLIQIILQHQMVKTTVLASLLATSFFVHAEPQALDKVVAIVDSSVILESDLDDAIASARQQLTARNQKVPSDSVLRSEVLRQIILKRAQLERVQRLGVTLDEATLNAAISEIAKQEGATSLSDFQTRIDARNPGAYAALRQQVNEDLSLNRLRQQQVNARIKVSEQDIDNFLKSPQAASIASNEIRIVHLRVSLPDNPSNAQVQAAASIANTVQKDLNGSNDVDAIIKKNQNKTYRIEGSDMGWRNVDNLPEALAAQVSRLSVGQTLSPARAADGFHVIKLADSRTASDQTIIKQYKVRHILIRPSEVVSLADAEQHINQIYKRATATENFANLASTFSNDPGSAANGGDLGWVSTGMMVPQFDEVMVKATPGQVSLPFQTQYGWHILKVDDTRQQDVTEQSRRSKARQILAERQFEQELDNWLREVRADTYVEIKDGTKIS